MAFPPSVTVNDYTWGGTKGYPNPMSGSRTTVLPDHHPRSCPNQPVLPVMKSCLPGSGTANRKPFPHLHLYNLDRTKLLTPWGMHHSWPQLTKRAHTLSSIPFPYHRKYPLVQQFRILLPLGTSGHHHLLQYLTNPSPLF